MTLSGRCCALLAALLFATPLGAQEAPVEGQAEDDTIVVTGSNERVSVAEVQRQARDIAVRTGSILESPLARFEDRFCPGVVGLEGEYAALFNNRLRANAEELGLRLLGEDCQPNFLVVFTEDGEALMRNLMEESPHYFQYLDSGERNDILEPGPVHVWTNVEPRTLTGMPIAQVRNLVNPPQMGVWAAHTRIYTTTRNDIVSVMITYDRDAVRGMTIGQLADYATMRGLAQTRVPEEPVLSSILSLFQVDAAPLGLTDFDRAYLASLYDGLPNLPAFRKLSGTAGHLRRLREAEREIPDE